MNGRIFGDLKRHMLFYHLFYLVAYSISVPALLLLFQLLFFDNKEAIRLELWFILAIFLSTFATAIRLYYKLPVLARIILLISLAGQAFCLWKLQGFVFSDKYVLIVNLAMILASAWYILMFFLCDIPEKDIRKELGYRILVCFAALYVPYVVFLKYYGKKVIARAVENFMKLNAPNNYELLQKVYKDAVMQEAWKLEVLLVVLLAVTLAVFFVLFKKVARRILQGEVSCSE